MKIIVRPESNQTMSLENFQALYGVLLKFKMKTGINFVMTEFSVDTLVPPENDKEPND